MKQIYDVIVAGGGPAGSTAARAAAMRGMDVLILEKSPFPRYKPCGGALSLKALSMLDWPLPPQVLERKITGARVHYRDLVLEKHKDYEITWLINRSAFDQYLLERAILAGAKAKTEKVLGFRDSGESVSVQTKDAIYKSRFLVMASGCQDALKKEIAGPESKESMGVCLVSEIEAEEERIVESLGSALDIHFSVAGGYGWIFPHRGYYSVGIGGLSSCLPHPRQAMRRFLMDNGFSEEARLSGHLIPQGGNRRRVARGRVLLAGDAAGFVDPFTGEGIYYALASGRIAGETVGDVSAAIVARSYESRIEKEFGSDLRYALFFSRIMHSHPSIFLRILAREEKVLERYLEVGAGEMSYRDFMLWLLPRLPLSLMRAGWL
jgi:geranylgeranyl reductase family protein